MKSDRLISGLIVILLVVLGAVYLLGRSIKSEQHSGCLGGTVRSAQQLRIDYAIYEADVASASSPGTGRAQRRIRAHEAHTIAEGMRVIASDRFDVRYSHLLAAPLAVVADRTRFRCP